MNRKVLLCILDGYGLGKVKKGNAIHHAHTPTLDNLFAHYPYTALEASGVHVGLPQGQVGNSEVGHLTIGAGQVIKQGLSLINNSDLQQNSILQKLVEKFQKDKKYNAKRTVHVVGIISDGGVHGHFDHMYDILNFLKQNDVNLCVHAITDGRDSALRSAESYLKKLEQFNIASICGRFYAMDRDKRWERTSAAYNAIACGNKLSGDTFNSYKDILEQHYKGELSDEFILPSYHKNYRGFDKDDIVIFTNFRADRMRQLASAITQPHFEDFERKCYVDTNTIGMMSYSAELDNHMEIMFVKEHVKGTLGEYISSLGLKQLRIAETEKYAHVTFFFNGGREEIFEGEDRILVPSPKVKTYDMQPEMSADKITDHLIEQINKDKYDFICINYANVDMVGHTGNFEATVKAVEYIDACVEKVIDIARKQKVDVIITADHGNAEDMIAKGGLPQTAHTTNKVPLIYIGDNKEVKLNELKGLSDIANLIKYLIKQN